MPNSRVCCGTRGLPSYFKTAHGCRTHRKLKFDPITADWTYIRWLGDHKAIEARTATWDKIVVDRAAELSNWVDFCYQLRKRGVLVYAYTNNHYALCRRRHNACVPNYAELSHLVCSFSVRLSAFAPPGYLIWVGIIQRGLSFPGAMHEMKPPYGAWCPYRETFVEQDCDPMRAPGSIASFFGSVQL